MRIVIVIILLGSLPGCARPNYTERWPDRFALSGGAQPGYAIKRVIEKLPPVTLVADDGSVCGTSRERFAGVDEGNWIACVWNLPSMDSTEVAQAGH